MEQNDHRSIIRPHLVFEFNPRASRVQRDVFVPSHELSYGAYCTGLACLVA